MEELSGDLDYIKQEADRKKCEGPKTMGKQGRLNLKGTL